MKPGKLMLAAAAVGALAAAGSAHAGTGCNGVVNQFIWGCAIWDNNNGPQYPFYKKKVVHVPAAASVPAGTPLVVRGDNLVDARSGRIVASGAGNIVASGAGNIVASGAGNVVVSLPPN